MLLLKVMKIYREADSVAPNNTSNEYRGVDNRMQDGESCDKHV